VSSPWNAALTKPSLAARTNSLFYVPASVKLKIENVGLVIKRKKLWCRKGEVKKILNNISCNVSGGEIMAIMGPSGAGKTSLLNCATLNNPKRSIMAGKVTLNGQTLTSDLFREHCYIVYQKDFLAPKLTCRETLMYSAINCIKDSKRIDIHVDELISNLGLECCQHTYVGDEFTQGLSGGEKRRLSVCIGLVKMPKILFLDEPTSGLDALSAFKTCEQLRNITVSYNIAAVLTIHQPNTKIYDLFTKLLLLWAGNVAYFGHSCQAEKWFADRGHKLPIRTNIADFLLDVLEDKSWVSKFEGEVFVRDNAEFSSFSHLTDLTGRSQLSLRSDAPAEKLTSRQKKPSIWKEIYWTIHREALLIFRNPMLYSGRCAAFNLVSVLFATIYILSRERSQKQVVSRLWLILWLAGVPTSMACVVVFGHFEDIINMTRSVRNGIMHPVPFLIARLLKLPIMFAFSASSFTLGGYLMCNWYWPGYAMVVMVNAINLLTWELQAELFAVITPNQSIGMLAFMGLWFVEFIFCGMMIADDDVVWPLRAITYAVPVRYGIKSIIYIEYINSEFSGADICDPANSTTCLPVGFTCGGRNPCFGATGEQVLNSLHWSFPLINAKDKLANSVSIMLAFCATIQIAYILRVLCIVDLLGCACSRRKPKSIAL